MTPSDPHHNADNSNQKIDLWETTPATPTILGKYRLLGELGRGGMGVVYAAEPVVGGPRVALKTLQAGFAASLTGLKAEFRIVSDLAHPNLVQLGELDSTGQEPFFTMEILDGTPFDNYVRSSFESMAAMPSLPFSELRLRESLKQLVSGLTALHNVGLIHRDIKPSNVLVTREGRVVILDMGLTVATSNARFQNSQREVAGTLYFMSPEQALGEPITSACDWYAVGVMLFEALTGERAFQATGFDGLLTEKLAIHRTRPKDVLNAIPDDLSELCQQLLQPAAEDRPNDSQISARSRAGSLAELESHAWIGRQRELEQLRESWRLVRAGVPQVNMVSGSSGMGKTALVDHFLGELRRQEAVVVLRGRCYENESVPYRGFDSVVDSLASYLRRLPKAEVERVLPIDIDMLCQVFPVIREIPAIARLGLRSQPAIGDPRERSQRGIAALRELICRLANFVSVVIFIDDLQQGDEDTATIFRELLRRDAAPKALFVATYRSEDAQSSSCMRRVLRRSLSSAEQALLADQLEISIDRLSATESCRLAASLLADQSTSNDDAANRIAEESEGDPLFIRMLAEHVVSHQAQATPSQTLRSQRLTLRTVIEERVASLEPHEQVGIEILATAGRPVHANDLEFILGATGGPVGVIRSLRVKRLIRRLGDRERVELFHDKIRETVLAKISPARLTEHCLSLAGRLESAPNQRDVDFLADLYRRAGNRELAGANYVAAAANAEESFAFYRAIECYQYAIEFLNPSGEREVKLRQGLGDALANSARSSEAAVQYLKAADVADANQRGKLQQLAALRYLTSGHVEQGISALRKVLSHYRLPWPGNRLRAVAGLLTRSIYLRIRGLRPGTAHQTSSLEREKLDACWSAAAGLSVVDPLRGTYYICETLCRSLTIGSAETLPRDLAAYIGQVAIGGSRSRRATRRVLLACRQLASENRDPYSQSMLLTSRGIAALLRGQWSTSLKCCDAAVKYLTGPDCYGKTWELNTARTFALWSLQYQGNLIELSRRQPELLRKAIESEDLFATLNFGTQVMAHLQLANDQPEESLRRLEQDQQRLSDSGFFIQHHNYVLAKTFTLLFKGQAAEALATIDGQWKNYRREFLSYIQQVRIDHRQVLTRALIAAAAAGVQRTENLVRARRLIVALRRERAGWATALATAFDVCCDQVENQARSRRTDVAHQLSEAATLLFRADMHLFAAAAMHHLDSMDSVRPERSVDWTTHGVANGERMANMMLPGFAKS